MKKIQELLLQGDAAAAVERLSQAVQARPEQAEQIADAMREVLIQLYGRYAVRPVHECVQLLEKLLSPEALEAIVGDLKPAMDRTRHWYGEIRAVRLERLLREVRSAISLNDLAGAAQLSRSFLLESRSSQEKQQQGRQLVMALAGLVRDQKRSMQVLQALMAEPDLGPFEFNLAHAFAEAVQKEGRAGFKESDREWTQALNAATVTIFDHLPGKGAVGEPSDEELARFCTEIEALLRAGLGRGRVEDLIDPLRLIMEFSPTDPSSLPSLTGVEPRAFLGIGPKAKLTAVRGLERVGDNEALRAKINELARSEAGRRRVTILAAAMGGLRQADFYPFLQAALAQAPNGTRDEEIIIDSIGRIGAPAGVDRILALLQEVMSTRKVIEPKDIKRAKMLLTALGRIGRAKGMDPARRNELVRRVIEVVGEREGEISFFAADQMFTLRLGEIDRPFRAWAVRQIARSMFAKDRGSNLQTAGTTPLGFRQPMAAALIRLGKEMLPEILEAAGPASTTYSGAFQAFGEVMEKIGDERAVPVLERMTRTAFAQDERGDAGSILAEQVGDAASGKARPLTRDDVLHSLIFSLSKTGGEPGKRVLLQIADQVQAGQLPTPGSEISAILAGAKREAGTLGKLEAAPVEDEAAVSEAEFKEALSQARPGLLKKAAKRIPAIAMLGRSRRPEGLHVLIECLGDKEMLVYRAAETALIQYVTPPPAPANYEPFLLKFFEDEKAIRGALLERMLELITRNFPKREPYSDIFRRSVGRYISDGPTGHRLNACMVQGPAGASIAKDSAAGGAGEPPSPFEARMAEMEKKKAYLDKRRAWIESGKQGPPPEPPQ